MISLAVVTLTVGLADPRAALASDDDDYQPEPRVKSKTIDTCGRFKFDVEGLRKINGAYEPYVYNVRGDVEKLACNKLPTKNKFGKEIADAVGAMRADQDDPSIIVVQDGKAWKGSKDDGDSYRFITVWAYSKHMKVSDSPCGGDHKMCEAGGNDNAAAYNALEHALARAAVHAGSHPERCKEQLKIAQTKVRWFKQEHDANGKAPYWKTNSIVTRDGKEVTLLAVMKRVQDLEPKLADELGGSYCTQKAN